MIDKHMKGRMTPMTRRTMCNSSIAHGVHGMTMAFALGKHDRAGMNFLVHRLGQWHRNLRLLCLFAIEGAGKRACFLVEFLLYRI